MMNTRLSWLQIFLMALSAVMIVGCATDQTQENADSAESADGTNTVGMGTDTNLAGTELSGGRGTKSERVYTPDERIGTVFGAEFDNPTTLLSKRVIYFQYDNSEVSPEYQPIIMAHVNYLAKNPKTVVILEGHTDERGSREYNLALGERRAQAVRQIMQLNTAPNQLDVVSYGEERPTAVGHDESTWQLSRRVEILYRKK